MRNLAVHEHAIELEGQIAQSGLSFTEPGLHRDGEQRIEIHHQRLRDTPTQQQVDVVDRCLERLLAQHELQLLPEIQTGADGLAENAGKRGWILRADAVVRVEQEQAFLHGAEDLGGFLLGLLDQPVIFTQASDELEQDKKKVKSGDPARVEPGDEQEVGAIVGVFFEFRG